MSDRQRRVWVSQDDKPYKTFYDAVTSGDLPALKAALESDVDVNALYGDEPIDGWTALHAATAAGRVEVIKTLLAHGAEVDARAPDQHPEGNGDETPLFYAARAACPEAVRALLDAGADVSFRSSGWCSHTALNLVLRECETARMDDYTVKAEQRHIDIIKLLLDAGADINHTPSEYWGGSLVSYRKR